MKSAFVKLLIETIHLTAGKNAPNRLKGDSTKKTNDTGSNKGNAEKTDAAGLNRGNSKKTNAAESNGGKTNGSFKKGFVRNLSSNVAVSLRMEDNNIDAEYEQAIAKLKQIQIGGDFEDSIKKKLDEAKRKFIELFKSGASIEDLNKSQEAIEKLEYLSILSLNNYYS